MTPNPAQFPVHFSAAPASHPPLMFVDLESPPTVGISAAWRKLITQANMAAPHLQIANIEGEAGSGKEALARHLHAHSQLASTTYQRRDAREWLATDPDPATLRGFFYLDRVDLLAPPGQDLLLGFLKGLQGRPSGRVIVVACSQNSLRQTSAQGLFIPDLAFRLTALRFAVPPLRQRREDIGPLAQFLLDRLCQRYQQRPVVFGPGTLARLLQHTWPGNVRELSSIIEAALLEAANGVIRPADLSLPDFADPHGIPGQYPPASPQCADLSLDAAIRQHIQYVLDFNRGNKLRAARQLHISRSTLYRILANKFPLTR